MRAASNRLLGLAEKYLKTDVRYLLKGGFWLSLGQFAAMGSSFLLSVVFANVLAKEVYGNYKFILSVASILATFSLTGIGTAITQAAARGFEGTLKRGIEVNLRWGIFIIAGAALTAAYYALAGQPGLALAILIAGIFLPIINAYSLYSALLNGRKQFKESTIYWSVTQLTVVAALIATAYVQPTVTTLVTVYFIVSAAGAYLSHRHSLRRKPAEGPSDEAAISYGKHISAMNLISGLANQLDKVLVFQFLGPVSLANYTFAFAIPEQIKGSFKNLFHLALPKYAVQERDALRRSVTDKMLRLTLITVGIVLGYIVLAPYIFTLLFPQYMEAVPYSQLYALGLLTIPGTSLFATYFQVRQDTRVLYRLNVASNILTIALTIPLVYYFGILGAVIENTVSWFAIFLLNAYFFFTEKES